MAEKEDNLPAIRGMDTLTKVEKIYPGAASRIFESVSERRKVEEAWYSVKSAREFIDAFFRNTKYKIATKDQYARRIKRFVNHCGGLTPYQWDLQHLYDFLDNELNIGDIDPAEISAHISTLFIFCELLKKKDCLFQNPFDEIDQTRKKEIRNLIEPEGPNPPEPEWAQKISDFLWQKANECKDGDVQKETWLRAYALIHVLKQSGLRIGDACNLQWKSVQEVDGEGWILKNVRNQKGKRTEPYTPFSESARNAALFYFHYVFGNDVEPEPNDWIFWNEKKNSKDPRTARKKINRWGGIRVASNKDTLERYFFRNVWPEIYAKGIVPKEYRLRLHMFKSHTGQRGIELGYTIEQVSKALSHLDKRTTEGSYVKTGPSAADFAKYGKDVGSMTSTGSE